MENVSEPSFLFGLDRSNHDFTARKSFGKNIFTNAFPLALAQYVSMARGEKIPLIEAYIDPAGTIGTQQTLTEWGQIIDTPPSEAHFEFEGHYSGYRAFATHQPNPSDVVVVDRSGTHRRPLEIKLMVSPTSGTAKLPYERQSPELVVRPPTVEQLAFSIAHSYGPEGKSELSSILTRELGTPSDYRWTDEGWMYSHLGNILAAADSIIRKGIENQTPLVLTSLWRSVDQQPIIYEHAFENFAWTDMAFIQLFTNSVRTNWDAPKAKKAEITRPQRSLIWLINSLFDYTAQGRLNFPKIHSSVTYNSQTDKAASFSGEQLLSFLRSDVFYTPRVKRDELSGIVHALAFDFLMPERRLDAAITIAQLRSAQPEAD